jgi:ATP:ADP antiporter, AAA family
MEDKKQEFGGWRALLWPIHRGELKKFLPMFFMFFLISFNYNALRACKDTLIVTAPQSGAEAIPFIKVWAILPGAFFFTWLFTRLASRFSREKVFYLMMTLFLSFFAIFTFVLFPLQDTLHPHNLANKVQAALPEGLVGLVAIFRHWIFTLFYVMSELWGTAILTVLFWGFANEVTNVGEAKRYYGLLMLGANIAGMLAGQASVFFSGTQFLAWIPYGETAWDQAILFLNCLIILSGLLTMGVYRWVTHKVIHVETHYKPPEKIKMSLKENFAYLARSKYLICVSLIVLGYNIVINLIEVVWKNQIKQLYPNPGDFNIYMGEVMTFMGAVAAIAALATAYSIRRFSWTVNALISPLITLVTGAAFFLFVLFPDSPLAALTAFFGATPLMLSVALGGMQNVFSRAAKYTVFDATKEIAFIPLSQESKAKGKAAIDGVGSRLGKSGGSVIHQSLLFFFSTIAASTPYVALIFLVVALAWIGAVFSLRKQFDSLTKPQAA